MLPHGALLVALELGGGLARLLQFPAAHRRLPPRGAAADARLHERRRWET
tara:strand:- start:43 stop:192 length:150 start_codon:yes stop_codon:yes gene_type:complete